MRLGSKIHTAGNTTLRTVDYHEWLDNTAEIETITVTSSSLTCTISGAPVILGHKIQYKLAGGTQGETLTLTLTMTDSFGNTKIDTIAFTCIAP